MNGNLQKKNHTGCLFYIHTLEFIWERRKSVWYLWITSLFWMEYNRKVYCMKQFTGCVLFLHKLIQIRREAKLAWCLWKALYFPWSWQKLVLWEVIGNVFYIKTQDPYGREATSVWYLWTIICYELNPTEKHVIVNDTTKCVNKDIWIIWEINHIIVMFVNSPTVYRVTSPVSELPTPVTIRDSLMHCT